MTTKQFVKWSGAAAILAGVLGIVNVLTGGLTGVYYTGLFLTLIAVVGIYFFQREATGTWGLVGFLLAAVGLALSIVGIPGISDMLYAVGMIVIAIAALRAHTFPNWVPWLWLGAIVIGISVGIFPNLQSIFYPLSSTLFESGFIGAGLSMWRSS